MTCCKLYQLVDYCYIRLSLLIAFLVRTTIKRNHQNSATPLLKQAISLVIKLLAV